MARVDLQTTYRLRFHGQQERRRAVLAVLHRRFFARWVRPSDTVVDLGAGYCEFINQVEARVRYAIDANPDCQTQAAAGVTVLAQDAAERWALASRTADVVFTSNFLEHVASKSALVRILEEVHRVLRPGGRLIAMGPNIRFCQDVYWDYFDHHIPLSDRSLAEALETAGFRIELVLPRFLPYTMKGGIGSRLPLGLYLLSLRLYLTLPSLWRLFGRQFLVVARKPNG
jgi:SAM-dependent methyltransferase